MATKTKIKTFEAACKLLKLDPEKVLPKVTGVPKKHQQAIIAHAQLIIIAEALNMQANNGKPWAPDWDNSSQYKYWPWFNMSSSGLSFSDFDFSYSLSNVGSRLCFLSRELAEYAGKQFKDLYEKYFLIQ